MIKINNVTQVELAIHPFIDSELQPTIQQKCKFITDITATNGDTIKLYNFNNNTMLIGTHDNKVVYVLQLQKFKNVKPGFASIQVYKTNISPAYERIGITSGAYKALVMDGKTCLISNDVQTINMANMWVKLATESATSEYKVNVVDGDNLLVDSQGDNILYNGTNVPDSVIWKIQSDSTINNVFFLLYKN